MLQRDRLGSVEGASVEIDHRDRPGRGVGVHARRRVVPARGKLIRLGDIDLGRIAGELGIGADEAKAAGLANRAAGAIAADQPARAERLVTSANGYVFAGLAEVFDAEAAPDLDPQRACASGQNGFELLQLDRHAGAGLARQAVRPFRAIYAVVIKLDTGEMA